MRLRARHPLLGRGIISPALSSHPRTTWHNIFYLVAEAARFRFLFVEQALLASVRRQIFWDRWADFLREGSRSHLRNGFVQPLVVVVLDEATRGLRALTCVVPLDHPEPRRHPGVTSERPHQASRRLLEEVVTHGRHRRPSSLLEIHDRPRDGVTPCGTFRKNPRTLCQAATAEVGPGTTTVLEAERLNYWPEGPGAPGRIRTCGLQVRNLALYPAELRARGQICPRAARPEGHAT